LDGLMHVIQPYADYSLVKNFGPKPRDIYQFDTVEPNTQPLPISFPDFQAIDAIDSWNILRLGIRNNLITRRDNSNYQWLTLDTFFDYNYLNPYTPAKIGNLNNYLMFFPSRWLTIYTNFQLPLDPNGFTQFDTAFSIMPCRNFQFSISHSYLSNYPTLNPFGFTSENSSSTDSFSSQDRIFQNRSQVTLNAYYRVNDNWGCSVQEQFDTIQNQLMYQRYYIHRDLSSWVASVGVEIRQNEGQRMQASALVLMTLKGAPQVTVPIGIPSRGPMGPGSSR
jgi:LPS-assembly protein